ncbi:hypothetical protein H0E84_08160 [Luteimonas sp. SJ-92]|uniref:Uncharacterized protein n=2 Tax=Luteimonas salinisoli TaxID=2752307 RepID=A0A853JCJ2_9GAMM|nr:hypothetical protein [Luteimonas salinisoli]
MLNTPCGSQYRVQACNTYGCSPWTEPVGPMGMMAEDEDVTGQEDAADEAAAPDEDATGEDSP